MSIHVSSGTNYIYRTVGVPTDYQAWSRCRWIKRKSDAGATEMISHIGSGTNPIQNYVTADDELVAVPQYSSSRTCNAGSIAVDEWVFEATVCEKGATSTITLAYRREDESGLGSVSKTNNDGVGWTTDQIYVGRTSSSGSGDFLIAYERYWDATLTLSELLAESQSATAVRTTDLLSDHPFTNMTLATALGDSSAANNDYTSSGSPTMDADNPTLTSASSTGTPESDAAAGTWTASTGSDLYAMIDETTPSDADYIEAVSAGTCRIAISAMSSPPAGWSSKWSYRIEGDVTVVLYDTAGAVTVATWTHTSVASPTTFTQTLSEAEKSSVTDWTALELRFTRP